MIPGAAVRTQWDSTDIWIRRTFELDALPADVLWFVHHDEDAEIYLNGRRVLSLKGFTTDYITKLMDKSAREAFRPGTNTLAVHCRQTEGGQYIDVGLVRLQESGVAVPSTTRIHGALAIRVNLTNHRTSRADLDLLIDEIHRIAADIQ